MKKRNLWKPYSDAPILQANSYYDCSTKSRYFIIRDCSIARTIELNSPEPSAGASKRHISMNSTDPQGRLSARWVDASMVVVVVLNLV